MNIIVCDGGKESCKELEDTIAEYASERDMLIDVEIFYSGDALGRYLAMAGVPDLLFLAVEQPSIDGVRIGSFIREGLGNEQMFLVYLSSDGQHALRLFRNRPFQFLLKPLEKEKVFGVLDSILRLLHGSGFYFEFHDKKRWNWIPYRDILYLQSEGKKVNIVMRHGLKSFYGKLSECKLRADYFLNIHKSCMVNCHYIAEYVREEVKMVNGHVLSISKANQTEVRKKLLQIDRNKPNWGWKTLGQGGCLGNSWQAGTGELI